MFKFAVCFLALAKLNFAANVPAVAPYIDATMMQPDTLTNIRQQTGLNAVTLGFVLGDGQGACQPKWGWKTFDDASVMTPIKNFQAAGGEVILATGGAQGPYLENSCPTAEGLAAAYKGILTAVGTKHLDIDIEAPVDQDKIMNALTILKSQIPDLTVSFTFMIQNDVQGMVIELGVNVLKKAVQHGVKVDTVNVMTMEFGSDQADWGNAVIAAAESTVRQMQEVWPSKSKAELYDMLGVTPMIGKNFIGRTFELSHARQLIAYAKQNNVGHLAFWSLGRDSGKCPGGAVTYDCSSIAQQDLEFTRIFQEYASTGSGNPVTPSTSKPVTNGPVPTSKPVTTTQSSSQPKPDCSTATYFQHESDCAKYYWCISGNPTLMTCAAGTVFDPKISQCNFPAAANRIECM